MSKAKAKNRNIGSSENGTATVGSRLPGKAWAVIGTYVLAILSLSIVLLEDANTDNLSYANIAAFYVAVGISVITLIAITKAKGPEAKWRWGKKPTDKKDERLVKTLPLVLQNFSKSYGEFKAVDSVSLEVKPGEVFGFLGPNGAGKSTVIRTILNFMKPSSGNITAFGLDSVKDDVAIKHHIGYLAGDIALYEQMTGWQVLDHLTSLGKQTDWQYVKELVQRLQATPERKIANLSKGNKQKIGLIQAFMHKPDLLVLDEPTSGLDPLMKQVFYDMVLEMRAAGKTVFVSSHDLTEVQKICNRAAFIRAGKLIAIEDVKNARGLRLQRYRVTFATKPTLSHFEKTGAKISDVSPDGKHLTITIADSPDELIKELAKHHVTDLDEQETTLEDLFINYYGAADEHA